MDCIRRSWVKIGNERASEKDREEYNIKHPHNERQNVQQFWLFMFWGREQMRDKRQTKQRIGQQKAFALRELADMTGIKKLITLEYGLYNLLFLFVSWFDVSIFGNE